MGREPLPAAEDDSAAYEALIQFLYQAPIGLVQTTLDGDILMINPMSARLLMPLVPDGNLSNLFDVLEPVAPALRARAGAATPGEGTPVESLRVQVGAATLSIGLLRLGDATLMASVSDVTDSVLRQAEHLARQLDRAARTDSLTAMPNRAVVFDRLSQALLSARADAHVAVMFLNCDRFARINDTCGRSIGDELLRRLADRLSGALRAHDAVGRAQPVERTAARLGGDEFVVLLDGLRHADDALAIAARLLDSLSRPCDIDGRQVHVAVSMGIVVCTPDDRDADDILQQASIAMHEAKRGGGGRYCVFETRMKDRVVRRGTTEVELRRALAEAELFVVYQPLVGLARGETAGVEALVRWRHPLRGVVPPIEFIEIAEETGLIGALGQFVLTEACAQFVRWQNALGERAPRAMSVNLSRAQLAEPTLTEQVCEALRRSGMAPRHLQLEVTESLAAQDELVQTRLHELKRLGLTLALDDFGTGYSSLSSLHLLPIDVVKIDRSFVSQVESSPHHRVLIEATIQVARSLGMGTVAEGIETEGQADVLTWLGCDKGQGYLFSRPLPADAAGEWLAGRPAPVGVDRRRGGVGDRIAEGDDGAGTAVASVGRL